MPKQNAKLGTNWGRFSKILWININFVLGYILHLINNWCLLEQKVNERLTYWQLKHLWLDKVSPLFVEHKVFFRLFIAVSSSYLQWVLSSDTDSCWKDKYHNYSSSLWRARYPDLNWKHCLWISLFCKRSKADSDWRHFKANKMHEQYMSRKFEGP